MARIDQRKRCSFWAGGRLIEKKRVPSGLGFLTIGKNWCVSEQSVNPTGFFLPFINAVDMQT